MNTGCAQVKSAINECCGIPECKTVHWGISDLHLRRCVWHRKECSKGLFNSSTRVQEPIREERAGARVFSEAVTPGWTIFPALRFLQIFEEQLLAEIRFPSLAVTCISSSEWKKEAAGRELELQKGQKRPLSILQMQNVAGKGPCKRKSSSEKLRTGKAFKRTMK